MFSVQVLVNSCLEHEVQDAEGSALLSRPEQKLTHPSSIYARKSSDFILHDGNASITYDKSFLSLRRC